MTNSFLQYALLLLAGCVAGIINTIAGGGSFLTLPALMALGMTPAMANGTNRVAVVVQAAVGSWRFHRAGQVDYRWVWRLAPPLVVGALAGAWLASVLDPQRFEKTFGALLLGMAVVVALKPRLFQSATRTHRSPTWLVTLAFLFIGFFGGFIQAGVGILLVSAMLLLLNLGVVLANSIKLTLVLIFTLPALLIFAASGQVEWLPGSILSVGNAIGAWLGVRIALRVPARVVLLGIAAMAGATGLYLLW